MKVEKPKEKYDQLIADGYCVVEDVLKEDMLNRLRIITDELLDAQTEDAVSYTHLTLPTNREV